MKCLLLATILLCLFGVMCCENAVTGDFPIVIVDDTITLFVQPDDFYFVQLTRSSCQVHIERLIDENTTIEYSDNFYDIKNVNIVDLPGPGDNDT